MQLVAYLAVIGQLRIQAGKLNTTAQRFYSDDQKYTFVCARNEGTVFFFRNLQPPPQTQLGQDGPPFCGSHDDCCSIEPQIQIPQITPSSEMLKLRISTRKVSLSCSERKRRSRNPSHQLLFMKLGRCG